MRLNLAEYTELHDADALELLSILLIIWCRKNGRNPDELLPKCKTALERYRNGEYDAKKLFADF